MILKVCEPGASPVIKGACMIVHEMRGVFYAIWVVPQRS